MESMRESPSDGPRAVFALCADRIVRAYPSVVAARAAHPRLGLWEAEITEYGARSLKSTEHPHHYSLLTEEPTSAPFAPPAITASLNESLCRTNVQKAVRRQEPVAAALSVEQYLAQRPAKSTNEYQKKLLERIAIMAAEDVRRPCLKRGCVTSCSLPGLPVCTGDDCAAPAHGHLPPSGRDLLRACCGLCRRPRARALRRAARRGASRPRVHSSEPDDVGA